MINRMIFLLLTVAGIMVAEARETPSPLFRDPVTDGAADPCLVYNRGEGNWWMLYTQRRANSETADVAYCYGNRIGIASSDDGGADWVYRGTLDLDFEPGHNTFWAPEIVVDDQGIYHLFVTYIRGVRNHWGGNAKIVHYTSPDLWDWKYMGPCGLPVDNVIDPTIARMDDGTWRMWYKWDSKSFWADSPDLVSWTGSDKPAVGDHPHEGAKVFKFGGHWWLVTDEWQGMAVYRSDDLSTWTRQPDRILATPGTRADDYPSGSHGDVVVSGDRAYIFYFTHPGRRFHTRDHHDQNGNIPYEYRRSSILVAELEITPAGNLAVKDRSRPVDINLLAR